MINVAIIGTGNISPYHIEAYLKFADRCKIVALVDIYPEKAKEKKELFGLVDAVVYDDYKKILGRDDIELVDICTPPFTHANIAVDFLNNQKNVILEKPMAASIEECDRIIEAVEKNKKIFSPIAQNRFRNPIHKLKQILDSRMIGNILHFQVDSLWWRGHCYYDLWWRGTWEKEGGGCTLNHAVHHIDMLIWMMGLPDSIYSILSNVAHDNAEVEDISIAILKYKNALAQITSSVVHHGEEQKIIVQGEKAKISYPWNTFASTSAENGFPIRDTLFEEQLNNEYQNINNLQYEGHIAQIQDVLFAIENQTQPKIKAIDGRNTIELITAIYKSGIEKEEVTLPIQKTDEYYKNEKILNAAPRFNEKTTTIENFKCNKITTESNFKY